MQERLAVEHTDEIEQADMVGSVKDDANAVEVSKGNDGDAGWVSGRAGGCGRIGRESGLGDWVEWEMDVVGGE